MFQIAVVEKIKTHFVFNKCFFENRAVYEIMWKGMVEPCRQQMTIWRMRILCWIPKATDTHSEYDIFVNCNWVVTRWQKYSIHLHTNNT